MGFEPRAAERLRLAVASAKGALDDIAHLIGETDIPDGDLPPTPGGASSEDPSALRRRHRSLT